MTAATPKAAKPRRPSSPPFRTSLRFSGRPAPALRRRRAPILWKAGLTNVGTATTAPSLTAADRKPDYFGYMRTIYSDSDQGFNDAEWFFNELKCKTLATIHDGSPYASQLAKVAADHFKELGGEVVAEEAVTPTDVDMRPVLTGIGTKKPCVVYFPTFVAATAQIVRQAPEIPDLKDSHMIGGSAVMAPVCSKRQAMRQRISALPMSTSRLK